MSSSNCCFLTCIQDSQEAGQMVWYSHLLQNFPQFVVIHTVKGFGIVNKAVDVFLELFCFFDDPADVGNSISGSSAFSKSSLNIWKFTVHIMLKPGLENFEHYFTTFPLSIKCAPRRTSWALMSVFPSLQLLKVLILYFQFTARPILTHSTVLGTPSILFLCRSFLDINTWLGDYFRSDNI